MDSKYGFGKHEKSRRWDFSAVGKVGSIYHMIMRTHASFIFNTEIQFI